MKLYQNFKIINKIAIVIGGSGQLGHNTINVLLEAGCKVINLDLFPLKKKIKNNYFFYKTDITNENQIIYNRDIIKKKFKKIDILINHSHFKGGKNLKAKNVFFSELKKYPSEIWKKTIDVNINGMFYSTKHFLPLLLKNKDSVVVNTSSTYGKISPNKNIYGKSGINCPISYTTSKFAVIGFTKYLATHYADKGLRANVLVPGGILNAKHSISFKKNYAANTPLKRMSNEKEYREAILFLVSKASSYMSGTELVLDGGWTAW